MPPQFERLPEVVTPLSRRIQIRPRSNEQLQIESSQSRDTIPAEQVYVIRGGANVLVDGVAIDVAGQTLRPGVLDLSADRIVIWTEASENNELPLQQDILQTAGKRFQVYLEGNILVRLKDNTITATHAFFDANNDRALLLNAEMRAFLPQTGGSVRVRAARLRQLSANRFHAQNGWTTTSPYGKPGYRIQASDIFVEPGPISPFTELDPITGPAGSRAAHVDHCDEFAVHGRRHAALVAATINSPSRRPAYPDSPGCRETRSSVWAADQDGLESDESSGPVPNSEEHSGIC